MKTRIAFILVSILICAQSAACGPSQADVEATSTQIAWSIFATQTAQVPTASLTPEPSATPTIIPTPTVTPTETPAPTATMSQYGIAIATQHVVQTEGAASAQKTREAKQSEELLAAQQAQQAEGALWAQLAQDESITYQKGTLLPADDFEESWAQLNWYQWWYFGYDLSDFVIATHVEWDSPEDAQRGVGGCGFAIRIKDNSNHLVIFVTPDKQAMLGAMSPRGFSYPDFHWQNPEVAGYSSDTPPRSGSVDFIVVAEKEFVTAYVDGVKLYQWYVALTNSGDIGYTILSGTNKDFGTYCKFTDTRIWELVK